MNAGNNTLSVTTSLPEHFRHDDFFTFHRRDKHALSERVEGRDIYKGMLIKGVPSLLKLSLLPDSAHLAIHCDGEHSPVSKQEATALLNHMLGLKQTIGAFEASYRNHADISRLLAHTAGLRIPQTVTPFEAITWAITGQLISVGAAVSLRRRLTETTGKQHSSGLWCPPDEHILASTDVEVYRRCGYSNSKAATIKRIAQLLLESELSLSLEEDPETVGKQLIAVKGIGPWTVSYTLLRGFGWLDGSLHGDVAVRRNLQRLCDLKEKPTEKETQAWLAPFSPYRALVAAHLWAMDNDKSY